MRLLLPVLVLSLLITACGSSTPEPPAPAPISSSPSATAAPSPTRLPQVALPPRPRDIDTTGVDVCTLLTNQQRPEFGFNLNPVPDDTSIGIYLGTPVHSCTFTSVERAQNVGLLISASVGLDVWTTTDINGTMKADSVNGFPAITVIVTGQDGFCTVVVGLGPHAVLDVNFGDGGRDPAIPLPTLCQRAHRSAELAMTTLTTTMGR